MILEVETLEEFFALLEAEENKEQIPIFIGQRRTFQDPGTGDHLVTGAIVIQYRYDNGMIAEYETNDGIDPFALPGQQFYTALALHGDEPIVKAIQEKAKQRTEKFDSQIKAEYEKAKQALIIKGFKSIYENIWTE